MKPVPNLTTKLSFWPSHADRWLNCLGSAWEYTKYPFEPSTLAGDYGNISHKVSEIKLKKASMFSRLGWKDRKTMESLFRNLKKKGKMPFDFEEMEKWLPNEFKNAVAQYVAIGNHLINTSTESHVEMMAEMDNGVRGKIDLVVIKDHILHIIDLKTGRGVVHSFDNPQMMIYGLGVLEVLKGKYDIREVHFTIIQPRIERWRSFHKTTPEELYEWKKTLDRIVSTIKDMQDKVLNVELWGDVTYNQEIIESTKKAGTWCKWCRVKTKCAVYKAWKRTEEEDLTLDLDL